MTTIKEAKGHHSKSGPPYLPDLATRGLALVLGPPSPASVPERIRNSLQKEQESCEILITLVQFVAIATFAVLYALTPKAFPADVPFEPVPMALGAYAIFTTIRLIMALNRVLPFWFLVLSVIVDITVLLVTIWSFHLQYEAPAAIYLKAPTLMYVFILIALRTLSFEPWLVIIGGVTAALGWTVLLGYAVFFDDRNMITRNFADYVTSHMVLLGAEFDKVVSILMVTVILAIALVRSRKSLVRAVTEQQAAQDLSRFFAPEVAAGIRATEHELKPGMADSRHAAIMFVDLRGFTNLSNTVSPRDVMEVLSDYQERIVMAVREHGGSIDKFMGDGILVSFGATSPSDSFAADGLRAVEAVVAAGNIWREERRRAGRPEAAVACAMTTGTVMFGTVGDQQRLEYTVLGEPVNLAAKLEKHCKVEDVQALVPLGTMQAAREQGFTPQMAWGNRPDRQVEGFRGELDLEALSWP
ncbi:MAG: adenylate/guanylate cyclase domain-containing protein [Pseudomonadota bacterium]